MAYAVLRGKIEERGVKRQAIADALGITTKTLRNKLNGHAPITWPEACVIQSKFFPDMDKDDLFISEA